MRVLIRKNDIDRAPAAQLAAANSATPGTRLGTSPVMLTIILIVALLLALGGGGWGYSRYGYASWSPAGIIVLVLIVMLLTGNLHV